MKFELLRKFIHISSLWMVVLIYTSPKWLCLYVFLCVLLILLAFDCWRYYRKDSFLTQFFGSVLRNEEKNSFRLSGATWMLVAASLCVLFFVDYVSFAALLVLIVSDSLAAIIGKKWGSIGLLDKSLQGSVTFLISAYICLLVTIWLFHLHTNWYMLAIIVASLSAGMELISKRIKLDDNLTIPLVTATAMFLLDTL